MRKNHERPADAATTKRVVSADALGSPSVPWHPSALIETQAHDPRIWTEEHYRQFGIQLRVSQRVATLLGFATQCGRPACMRAGACAARKLANDWSMSAGPMMPPCCDTDDRIETVKALIRHFLRQRLGL